MSETKTLLIVGHAPSPNTRALRDAVVRGAEAASDGETRVIAGSPFDFGPDDVRSADGIILGTTENLGYMSGALKDFFDRTYYGVLEDKQGLPYGLYIRAGHDGTGTRRGIEGIVTGLRWRAVAPPVIAHGDWNESFITDVEELGALMAAGLEAGIF